MTAAKTNEAPVKAHKSAQRGEAGTGVRSTVKFVRTSSYKMRVVLNLIRGQKVADAADILRLCERDAAITIGKVLKSAVANAVNNDGIPAEELYVSACYADEGPTIKRFRPRARGRTGRILKRTSHITVIVSRLPEDLLVQARTKSAEQTAQRAARTAASRAAAEQSTADARRDASGTTEAVAGATLADEPAAEAPTEASSEQTNDVVVDETAETSAPEASEPTGDDSTDNS
jgi:large subunit ribosomal protein L22